jgi:hypothetical protein
MLATVGRRLSFQVSKELYDDLNRLNQRIATPMVVHSSAVLARNSSKGVMKATGKIVGSVITRAAARAAVKGGITGGAAESAETTVAGALSTGFKLGYPAAITGASLGIVSVVAVVANASIEGPMLARGIYKLRRKKKFKKISKQAYKRGVTHTTITRVSTFIGGSGGALLGQVIIPVPVLGAVVGGITGTVAGKVAGHFAGSGIANRAFREKTVDLPAVVSCEYVNISDL